MPDSRGDQILSGRTSIEWTERTWNPTRGCSDEIERCRREQLRCREHILSGRPDAFGAWLGLQDWFKEELILTREDLASLVDFPEEVTAIVVEVARELARARGLHAALHSAHEGYAVILEELDELKVEVWKRREARDLAEMRKETVQVAAMALRFALEVCGGSGVR